MSEGAAIPGSPIPPEKEGGQSPFRMGVTSTGTLQGGASGDGVSLGAALCHLSWHNEGLFLICVSPGELLLSIAVFETLPLFSENQ